MLLNYFFFEFCLIRKLDKLEKNMLKIRFRKIT